MEKFLSLPIDKQTTILNAAFTAFGKNGYKKASVSDIAATAGISKAMVFYYFGSKKSMYLYLVEQSGNMILNEIEKNMIKDVTDFFNKLKMASQIKMSVFKKHPSALLFIKNVYFETDPQVANELKEYITGRKSLSTYLLFDNLDLSVFKEDVDPDLLLKFITWASEGFISSLSKDDDITRIDTMIDDFYKCLDFMKSNFYKSR